jgi:Na+/H+-dicarboxylate symporter
MSKSNKLTLWIFIALIIGVITGVWLNQAYPINADGTPHPELAPIIDNITIFTDVFLRLIKMIIAPLVFSTLVVGVAKLGDIKAVGRIGGKTMLWFISASFVSLLLGCLLVNIFQPGHMMQLELPPVDAATGVDKAAMTLKGFVTHIFPKSVIEAMATNEILQIVIFSLFLRCSYCFHW